MASIILAAAGTAIGGSVGGCDPRRLRRGDRRRRRLDRRRGDRLLARRLDGADAADRRPAARHPADHRLDRGRGDPARLRRDAHRRQHHLGDRLPRGDPDHPPGGGGKGGGGGGGTEVTEYFYFASLRGRALRGPDHRHRPHLGRRQADDAATASPCGCTRAARTRSPTRSSRRRWARRTRRPIAARPMSSSRSCRSSASATGCRSSPSRCSGRSSTATSAESLVRAVTLIPASGEFAYATELVRREGGDGETVGGERQRRAPTPPTSSVALDRLEACAPKVESVSLVVAWFGDDLRAGHCRIRPGVEVSAKSDDAGELVGRTASAAASAHLVSRDDRGRPAYGGTPSDSAVVQAIQELKARGYRVTFYPFILMDVPAGQRRCRTRTRTTPRRPASRPIPGAGGSPARRPPGYAGSADKTAAAGTQVAAFFGDAAAVRLRRRRRARRAGTAIPTTGACGG